MDLLCAFVVNFCTNNFVSPEIKKRQKSNLYLHSWLNFTHRIYILLSFF